MRERVGIVALLHRLMHVLVCGLLMAVISGYTSSVFIRISGLAHDHSLFWFAFEGMVFALFTIAYQWAGLLFFGAWIVFFTPRGPRSWSLLLGASLLAGLLASWVFQSWPITDSPDSGDFTDPVQMLGAITWISCLATLTASSLMALVYSQFEEKSFFPTNMLADGSI